MERLQKGRAKGRGKGRGTGMGASRIKTHKHNITEPECNIPMGQRNVWEKGCRIRSIWHFAENDWFYLDAHTQSARQGCNAGGGGGAGCGKPNRTTEALAMAWWGASRNQILMSQSSFIANQPEINHSCKRAANRCSSHFDTQLHQGMMPVWGGEER